MIRGKVELLSISDLGEETLLLEDSNMILDGAGEAIAFMMTIPADGSGISPRVYDASNFCIQSISFGKDQRAYLGNLHSSGGIFSVGRERVVLNLSSAYWAEVSSATASAYVPNMYLPDAPNPIDDKVVKFNQVLFSNTNPQYPHMLEGQTVNLLPYYQSIPSSLFGINVSVLPLSTIIAIGGYVSGISVTGQTASSMQVQLRYPDGTTSGTLTASTTLAINTVYNSVTRKSVDPRGFFRSANSAGFGLQVSTIASSLSSTCEIVNLHTINSVDSLFMNLYGGITSIGLWIFNMEEMLKNNYTPPYNFFSTDTGSVSTSIVDISGNLKYKLIAKKVFQDNIVKSRDNGATAGITTHQNLTIRWRLFFK